ncbi:hypothetical protein [Tenacibaculum sp. SG-28]|uniref:hypothetical protein n=1 Tax=Tenacibaculum sp. SG-28 TaxID=754426 RepID=UPI000CF482EA|nr:hypothetical protein [Tenacibaculum sp. SG-28]PQJ19716.1 hypothetical protein BSU00_12190 [Tenacibaculum sp. SG-28]
MNKAIAIIIVFLLTISSNGQTLDKNSLIGLPKATTNELEALQNLTDTASRPELGSLAFDTDKDRVMQYTTAGWKEVVTARNIYMDSFIISKADENTNKVINSLPFVPTLIKFVAYTNVESFGTDDDNGVIENDGNNNFGVNNTFGSLTGFARLDNDPDTIVQQVIYISGHGNSINDISRFASNTHCIGARYGDQNGNNLGKITASLVAFTNDGFTLDVEYSDGTVTNNTIGNIVRP